MINYKERRKNVLSEDEFKSIVKAAAIEAKELAKQELLIEIGKSTLSKMRWILYAGFIAAATWLASHGFFSK